MPDFIITSETVIRNDDQSTGTLTLPAFDYYNISLCWQTDEHDVNKVL